MAHTDIYYTALRRRKWWKWTIAALVAGILNGSMFLLLPTLIISDSSDQKLVNGIPMINVIRLKRVEQPPKKKRPPQKPEKTEPKKEPIQHKTKVVVPKLSMPFVLSPTMPSAPASLQLPSMQTGSFSPMGDIKGVEAAQLDGALIPVTRVPPVYPLRAKRRGIEGWVRVRFLVDEQGVAGNITIVEAQPGDIFNKSVLTCVSRWRYNPGTVEGVPVGAWVETTIKFELEQ